MFVKDNLVIDLSTKTNALTPLFTTKHLDTLSLQFKVTNNSRPFTVDNHQVAFYCELPDGQTLQETEHIMVEGNVINIVLPNHFSCVAGKPKFEFEFTNEEGTTTSPTFCYEVQKRIKNEDCVEGSILDEIKTVSDEAREVINTLIATKEEAVHEMSIDVDTLKRALQIIIDSAEEMKHDLTVTTDNAIKVHDELSSKYQEVKDFSKEFDLVAIIPTLYKDVEDLKVAPVVVDTYVQRRE